MRLITLTIFAVLLLALSCPNSADVGLADWCVNLNGNIDVCNAGAAPGGNANVNVSAFDPTLETAGPNTLGSITVTIGTGVQYAAVYMDYDVNYSTWGSFTDVGSVNGSPSEVKATNWPTRTRRTSSRISPARVLSRIPTLSTRPRALRTHQRIATFPGRSPSRCLSIVRCIL